MLTGLLQLADDKSIWRHLVSKKKTTEAGTDRCPHENGQLAYYKTVV